MITSRLEKLPGRFQAPILAQKNQRKPSWLKKLADNCNKIAKKKISAAFFYSTVGVRLIYPPRLQHREMLQGQAEIAPI